MEVETLRAKYAALAPVLSERSRRCWAAAEPPTRIRRAGGGREALTAIDATLLHDLDALVEPTAPGDPDSPLRWCCQSTRTLAFALQALGHHISHTVVAELLHALGYSLQGNVKTTEGRQHPDRDAQFRDIAAGVVRAHVEHQPAISVDTQEERTGGRFQECRTDVAPHGRARAYPRP